MPPPLLVVLPWPIALLTIALLLLLLKIAVEEGSTLDVLKAATGVLDGRVKGKLFDFSPPPTILSLTTVGDADFLFLSLLNMIIALLITQSLVSAGFLSRQQVDFNFWRRKRAKDKKVFLGASGGVRKNDGGLRKTGLFRERDEMPNEECGKIK
jgi:hypothetical protein